MGFTLTNISALNAINNLNTNTHNLNNSLTRLSSGLRINSAADDSSGMAIADSLRSQANSIKQAIRNANDGRGMLNIADKAMEEQIKILDTIKVKATQAASDTQSTKSRQAIANDIGRLIEQLDNIASQTSYNGISLLAGSFTNKEFQIGAYSYQTVKVSIGSTHSSKIGHIRKETTNNIVQSGETQLSFKNPNGGSNIVLESVKISTSAGTGLGVLEEVINKNSEKTGVKAKSIVITSGNSEIESGSIENLVINGVTIGNLTFDDGDKTGSLVTAINAYQAQTGIKASTDVSGKLVLTSLDKRGIKVEANSGGDLLNIGLSAGAVENYGRLSLTSIGANDIGFSATNNLSGVINSGGTGTTMNLRSALGNYTRDMMDASGAYPNEMALNSAGLLVAGSVITGTGAMMVMDMAEAGIRDLDKIRSDIGSVTLQLDASIRNLSVMEVNVRAAESGIRDVDFAMETAEFSKNNILVQMGSYALSQANATQQMVLKLLQ